MYIHALTIAIFHLRAILASVVWRAASLSALTKRERGRELNYILPLAWCRWEIMNKGSLRISQIVSWSSYRVFLDDQKFSTRLFDSLMETLALTYGYTCMVSLKEGSLFKVSSTWVRRGMRVYHIWSDFVNLISEQIKYIYICMVWLCKFDFVNVCPKGIQ